jgi:hypothetical protein
MNSVPSPEQVTACASAPTRHGILPRAALLVGLLAHPLGAIPVLIDDFSTGDQFITVNAGSPFASDTAPATGALGGSRTLTARFTAQTGDGDAFISGIGAGLAIGGNSSSGAMTVGLAWNAGGFDLTDGGQNNILLLDFFILDPGGASSSILFDFLFTSTLGDTASFSATVPAIPPHPSVLTLDLASASLSPLAGNTAFTLTDSVQLDITMDGAADFALNSISVGRSEVPDGGSTLLLLGVVVSLAGAVKWRLGGRV